MWLLLYNLLVLPLAAAFAVLFALSPRRGLLKDLPSQLGERFGRYGRLRARLGERPVVWVHAASVGEVNAVKPLIDALRAARPGAAVLMTCSNAPARAHAAQAADAAALAPIDSLPLVAAALDAVRPKALVVAETEVWPSLLAACRARGIPAALVNARMSEKSLARYRLAQGLFGPAVAGYALVTAQSRADAARFRALGAKGVETVGNLKHDRLFDGAADLTAAKAAVARLGWQDAPILVAGSTHEGDERPLLDAWRGVLAKLPEARLVLAPRHLERLEEAAHLLRARGVPFLRWSEVAAPDAKVGFSAGCLLVDRLGVLGALYGIGRAAFVGGTLAPRGGHNLLEPVGFSVPVVFGPHTENLPEVAALLEESGGGLRAADGSALAALLPGLLSDAERCRSLGASARKAAETLKGATARTLPLLLARLGL